MLTHMILLIHNHISIQIDSISRIDSACTKELTGDWLSSKPCRSQYPDSRNAVAAQHRKLEVFNIWLPENQLNGSSNQPLRPLRLGALSMPRYRSRHQLLSPLTTRLQWLVQTTVHFLLLAFSCPFSPVFLSPWFRNGLTVGTR